MADTPQRSADALVQDLLQDQSKIDQLKQDPERVLREARDTVINRLGVPADQSGKIYGRVIFYLGMIGLLSVASWALVFAVAVATFIYKGADIAQLKDFLTAAEVPSGIVALGSAAVGALAGLLAPTPGK